MNIIKQVLTLISICCMLQLKSQGVLTGGAIKNIQFMDAGGKLLPLGGTNVQGSPYLSEKFTMGNMVFSNGMKAADSNLNFSLFDQQMYFIKNQNLYLVQIPIKDFEMDVLDAQNVVSTKHFRNGFPPLLLNNQYTFYELMVSGKSLQLLKLSQKRINETTVYGAAPIKEYATDIQYFIYVSEENKMVSLGSNLSIKAFKKALPNLVAKIEEMVNAQHLNVKEEIGLIKLIELL